MSIIDQVNHIVQSGYLISIPFLQRKFKISHSEAKRIYVHFYPPQSPIPKKRTYYFQKYWDDEWKKATSKYAS